MAKPKSRQTLTELTPTDRDWLPRQTEAARGLVARYTGLVGWPENQIEDLERACHAWAADASDDKPAEAEVAEACGAVLGAWVSHRVGLKWMVRAGDRHTLVLWGRSTSGADVVADPVGMVASRMSEGLTEFLVELAEVLRDDLAGALAK